VRALIQNPIIVVALAATLVACADEPGPKTGAGIATGALAGALIGAGTGRGPGAAVAGAVIGGVVPHDLHSGTAADGARRRLP
jgi:hypothetical protein